MEFLGGEGEEKGGAGFRGHRHGHGAAGGGVVGGGVDGGHGWTDWGVYWDWWVRAIDYAGWVALLNCSGFAKDDDTFVWFCLFRFRGDPRQFSARLSDDDWITLLTIKRLGGFPSWLACDLCVQSP